MQYFFLKLLSPRPTFPQDITEEEKAIMQRHSTYWRAHMAQGTVIVFGPVLDPAGVYGVAIVKVNDAEQVKELIAGDPAIAIGKYEYYPIMAVTPAV